MILFRYRYRPVTVFSPPLRTVTVLGLTLQTKVVDQGCSALRTFPQRYPMLQELPSVTVRYRTLPNVTAPM